jgi:hypothetical protein
MPSGFHPDSHADSPLLQIAVKLLRFSIAVVQLPFAALSGFFFCERDLLDARVIVHSYNAEHF